MYRYLRMFCHSCAHSRDAEQEVLPRARHGGGDKHGRRAVPPGVLVPLHRIPRRRGAVQLPLGGQREPN
jgi:hypothetical protein